MNKFSVDTTKNELIFLKNSLSTLALCICDELVDTNNADQTMHEYKIPIDNFYGIKNQIFKSEEELDTSLDFFSIFGMPSQVSKPIHLDHKGVIGYKNFDFISSYEHHRISHKGPLLIDQQNQDVLGTLPLPVYQFFTLLSTPEPNNPRGLLQHHRRLYAKAKKLKDLGYATINRYTDKKDFIEVSGPLHLDLKTNANEIKLLPTLTPLEIPDSINKEFQEDFLKKLHPTTEIMLLEKSSGGNTQYVLLDEDLSTELDTIKSLQQKIEKDPLILSRLIKHPEEFFDPEKVNLDEFSERVAMLGIFKPIKLPYVSTAEVDWWGRVLFGDTLEEDDPITWLDGTQAEELAQLIEESKQQSKDSIDWHGTSVPLEKAENKLTQYRQVLVENAKPEKRESDKLDVISKQNVEELSYEIQAEIPSLQSTQFQPLSKSKCTVSLKKPYQEIGVGWLQTHCIEKTPGCLLADDMGLGKTLQVLYFLEWFLESSQPKLNKPIRIMLVSPKSLIYNWFSEYQKFFPQGKLEFFPDLKLPKYLEHLENVLPGFGYVHQCTYQALSRNSLPYAKIDWDIVITDEAQYAKTPGNRITNSLQSLKAQFKIAMTGTPVENNFSELWNIIDYIYPGYLGTLRSFNSIYGISPKDDSEEINQKAQNLRNKIGSLILRRRKIEVLESELPNKIIFESTIQDEKPVPIEIPLTLSQTYAYKEILKKAKIGFEKGKALGEIAKLRIISDHPKFIDLNQRLRAQQFTDEEIYESARMNALEKIIDRVKLRNEKALLFADYRFTQYLLKGWLMKRYSISPHIINGDSPVQESKRLTSYSMRNLSEESLLTRLQITESFNKKVGFDVLILSPIAAGVGLNIIGANHVVHFSRQWNPAKEDQATDRAYRIGQTKDVYVYLPKAIHNEFNTFDVNVAKILERKRSLAQASLYPTNIDFEDEDSIINLFFGT